MLKISTKSKYGLRAMVYLATCADKICPLKVISKNEGLSFDYLEKIIAKLEKASLIKTKRGVFGGYFLARKPSSIKVGEIVRALEGEISLVECLIKEKNKRVSCLRKRRCKTITVWKKLHDSINSALNSITLADLISSARKHSASYRSRK